ncbi:GGDEF domain-containing protein [Aliarcobacter butzleri]|uniref:GGDEF domain-containing protein n=1 Tax=Aliarcobacter butzleri TaxID=28197 RepID=UPI0021B367B9|nr:diguanylate cyclase [Aliarcobacter butzleri]MCT7581324.1 diguanylate cyclase [Aliarcobacter butzleri]
MDEMLSCEELTLKVNSLEKEVKFNNFFLKKMFDIMPSPMFYKNKNGVYEHCNDTFSRLILGIPKEEILGKTLYDLGHVIPKENADVYYEKDKNLFLTAKEQFYEGKVKCSDGVTRDYHFYKSSFVIDGEIIGLVGLMLDVSDYKKALLDLDEKNKLLNDLSIIDSLTSLYNRRYFQDILEKKVNQLIRFKHQFSFAIIDVDFFKDYNDYYGHQKGDLVLEEIGKALKNSFLRSTDYAFRIGGEEFAVLFDVNDFKDAFIIMERVRKKIEDLKIEASPKSNYKYLTVSIGLGNILKLDINTNPSIIYHEVDKLLYKSKKDDKNRVTVKDIIF